MNIGTNQDFPQDREAFSRKISPELPCQRINRIEKERDRALKKVSKKETTILQLQQEIERLKNTNKILKKQVHSLKGQCSSIENGRRHELAMIDKQFDLKEKLHQLKAADMKKVMERKEEIQKREFIMMEQVKEAEVKWKENFAEAKIALQQSRFAISTSFPKNAMFSKYGSIEQAKETAVEWNKYVAEAKIAFQRSIAISTSFPNNAMFSSYGSVEQAKEVEAKRKDHVAEAKIARQRSRFSISTSFPNNTMFSSYGSYGSTVLPHQGMTVLTSTTIYDTAIRYGSTRNGTTHFSRKSRHRLGQNW